MGMDQMWPRLDKCLCCIPLRIGAFIIGYYCIVVSSVFLIVMSWSIYKVSTFVSSHQNTEVEDHSPEEMARLAVDLYISHGYFLLVMLFNLAISVMMLVGLHANKSKYLQYYLIAGYFLLAMTLGLMVVTSLFFGLYVSVPMLVWCGILFYCLIIVRSTYMEIIDEAKRQGKNYELQDILHQPMQC